MQQEDGNTVKKIAASSRGLTTHQEITTPKVTNLQQRCSKRIATPSKEDHNTIKRIYLTAQILFLTKNFL